MVGQLITADRVWWEWYLPITLLDFILGSVRLDAELVVELCFFDHGCDPVD